MRRCLAALLLLHASAVLAAIAGLGPEKALSAPAIDAAEGYQTQPSLTWYGDSLAASWIDERELIGRTVRIAQLDPLGHPKGFAARLAAPVDEARLASNGAPPLIAMDNSGNTTVGPAGTSGRAVDGSIIDLVTDGSTYLLLTRDHNLHISILDAEGEEVAANVIDWAAMRAVVVPFAGAYHVVYTKIECGAICRPAIHDAVIDRHASVSDQILFTTLPSDTQIAAAAAGDHLLIAWTTPDSIEVRAVTAGDRLTSQSSMPAQPRSLFAANDGSESLIAWTDSSALHAVRTDGNANFVGDPFTLGRASARDLTYARTPSTVVLAWCDGDPGNIYTRGAANFAGMAAAHNSLASISYAQQQDLSLKDVAVWSEGETGGSIESADGIVARADEGHSSRRPVAARGAGTILVAWCDGSADGHSRIMARVGDGEPEVIGEADSYRWMDVDVTFDGESFLVFWSNGRLFRTRMLPSGVRLETTEIASKGSVGNIRASGGTVVFVDGSDLVYADGATRPLGSVETALVRPATATDDHGSPFIVWADGRCLNAAFRAGDVSLQKKIFCSGYSMGTAAVAWSGSEFVIAWDELLRGYRTVRVLRTTRTGNPIDDEPFFVNAAFRDTFRPALVLSPSGVTLGYQRVAGEEPFDDVSRVFTRTLARLGARRGRAAGR